MAKDTKNQRATLACLTTHLHGTSIATRVHDDGMLVAEFRAIGHSFRFHINPGGEVVERSCVADHIGVLSREELNILCSLTAAELEAGLAALPMNPREDLLERVAMLTNTQCKLAVAVETGQFLSEDDRRVLAQALADYRAGIHEGCEDTDIERSLSLHIEAIERKLSI